MVTPPCSRADLHCHSAASATSKLGVQRALGLPECATPLELVYAQAKRRGMDFVTITDHDTIAGALKLADRPDVFVSEELTAWFRGEPQARARALLRDHARGPRLASSDRPRRGPVRRVPARATHRVRPCPPVLRGGGAAAAPTPAAARGTLPGLGDAQWLAGAGAEHACRRPHRDPRRHGSRRLRRPRGPRHRTDVHGDSAEFDAGGVPRARPDRRRRGARGPGQRCEVDSCGDRTGGSHPRPGRWHTGRPARGARDHGAGVARRRRSQRHPRRGSPARARTRPPARRA